MEFENQEIKAVCFDAFGTLVEITDKRRPYIALLKALDTKDRLDLKNRLMRETIYLDECLTRFGHRFSADLISQISGDLEAELSSVRLRAGIEGIWKKLRNQGIKIALCSNLAASYGARLLEILPDSPDATILSYETGFIKPELGIYAAVVAGLKMEPASILFTGDTQLADVDGPKDFGMPAMLISELEKRMNIYSAA